MKKSLLNYPQDDLMSAFCALVGVRFDAIDASVNPELSHAYDVFATLVVAARGVARRPSTDFETIDGFYGSPEEEADAVAQETLAAERDRVTIALLHENLHGDESRRCTLLALIDYVMRYVFTSHLSYASASNAEMAARTLRETAARDCDPRFAELDIERTANLLTAHHGAPKSGPKAMSAHLVAATLSCSVKAFNDGSVDRFPASVPQGRDRHAQARQ